MEVDGWEQMLHSVEAAIRHGLSVPATWHDSDRLVLAWQANDLWRNLPSYYILIFLFQAGSPFTRYTCQLLGSNGQGLYHTFETHPMVTQGGRLVRALWRNKRIESSCDLMLNIWCLNRPQWTRWDSQAIMISVNWSFTGPDLWWYAFGSLLLEGLSFCFRFELRWKCP